MFEIRLVGTIDALVDGEPVPIPGRRMRALLALLALAPGEAVSVDALAAGIWDDDPPEHVRGSLQTYVARLRRVLGDESVATSRAGYTLLAPRRSVDLLALWDAVESARHEADPAAERSALAAVLQQWHAEAFGDAPSQWLDRHERPMWIERHLQAFERWVDLSFEAGAHQECLEELNRQVERHPLREPLWVRQLRALDHLGRTAEALDRYERVRKRLAEELGVDPSPELREVQRRLLERSDESVAVPADRAPNVVPRQLPIPVRGFVGREEQLAELDWVLGRAPDDEPIVVALHGPAGSGKTSLTLLWAHRVKERFGDGQLFVNLQGYGPGEPMSTTRALGAMLRSLGVAGDQVPDDVDERGALLRSVAYGRRLLVVLDNVRESEHVRPLLPGSQTLVLVTSRTQMRGLATREAAYRIAVDPMSPADALAMLQRRISDAADEAPLRELADLCGHLPVALAVAAERVGRDGLGPDPVGALVGELRDRRRRLDALTSWEDDPLTSVRAVLESSYRSLGDGPANVLRHLGLYTASTISVEPVTALVGADPIDVRRSIDRLTDAHLLHAEGDGYLSMHDLVRDFAVELAAELSAYDRSAATARLRSWFLHTAARAEATGEVNNDRELPDPLPGVVPAEFRTPEEAVRWFEAYGSYLADLIAATVAEDDPTGYLIAPMVFALVRRSRGSSRDGLALFQLAEAEAERLGDTAGQAICANLVAGSHYDRGEMDAAVDAVTRARDLQHALGSVIGELRERGNLAMVLRGLGRFDEAATEHEMVIEGARQARDERRLARFLFNASDFYLAAGRIDDAERTGLEAVEILSVLDDRGELLANATDNLGEVQAASGRLSDGIESMHEAIDQYRRLRLRGHEANAQRKLGTFYRDLGRHADARACWDAAGRLLDDIGITGAMGVSRAELDSLIESLGDA